MRGVFGSQSVDLLYYGQDTELLTTIANQQRSLVHIAALALQTNSAGNLEIGKSVNLSLAQQVLLDGVDILFLQLLVDVDNVLQFLQEPLVNLGQLVNTIDIVLLVVHGLRDDEDTLIGWLAQGSIDIVNLQFLVLYKSVHALTNHTQALLDSLLKVATDGHYLAYRLHR